MSEKMPKNSLEKMESVEKPPRYRTIKLEVLEIHEDGSKTERVLECNGLLHRRCVDIVFYDKNGEIEFVNQLSREELGPCDCRH
jgi:hypothetical protein